MTTWTFGVRVAVDDVVRDAVEVAAGVVVLAEVGVEPAVAVAADDVVHDGGRVGGHRRRWDLLVPGVVDGESWLPEQGGHDLRSEFTQVQPASRATHR